MIFIIIPLGMYSINLGYGCVYHYDGELRRVMYDGLNVLIYDGSSRLLRVNYRLFSSQQMRACKRVVGDELYAFLKKHKGEDVTYGEEGNDDTPQKQIIRFI